MTDRSEHHLHVLLKVFLPLEAFLNRHVPENDYVLKSVV